MLTLFSAKSSNRCVPLGFWFMFPAALLVLNTEEPDKGPSEPVLQSPVFISGWIL